MNDSDAISRVNNLFVSYLSILRRQGLSWVVEENQKVAVGYVLATIHPSTLHIQLESDLELSHHDLRKNFRGFIKHAIRLTEAFQLVDNGKQQSQATKAVTNKHNHKGRGGNSKNIVSSQLNKNAFSASRGKPPLCPYRPHRFQGIRHLLRDCHDCPDQEKKGTAEALDGGKV